MSSVTDIILVTSTDDGAVRDGEHPNVDELSAWLQERYGHADVFVKVDGLAGGGKAMQCDVFVAAINHLDPAAFLLKFKSVAWENPSCVQLMLKGEQEDLFTIYQFAEAGSLKVLDPGEARP